MGKSWLALDVCLAVASGTTALGNLSTTAGDVLYCALEDNFRRLRGRIEKLLPPLAAWPERLTVATKWRRLDVGGVADIAEWCGGVPEPRLVVLDTLAGIRPARSNAEAMYDGDYKALLAVHHMASERRIAVLVLHHTRKLEADDPLDAISGTLGLAGCADGALVINRTAQGTSLYTRGRDIEERDSAISFDKTTCRWSILGDAAEVHRSDGRQRDPRRVGRHGQHDTAGDRRRRRHLHGHRPVLAAPHGQGQRGRQGRARPVPEGLTQMLHPPATLAPGAAKCNIQVMPVKWAQH